MKYKKGTFVVIPNKQYLKGKPSEMQSIYFWLCEHADDTGGCFPTKETISDDAGCSHNTVDKYLKQLSDEGFLRITNRRKRGSKEFTSNHYQVLILTHNPKMGLPQPKNGTTGTPKNGLETNLNINEPNLNTLVDETTNKEGSHREVEKPFSFIVELSKLQQSKLVAWKIIHNYWVKKRMVFNNREQFNSAFRRNLKPANALKGYSSKEIDLVMDYCEKNFTNYGWTLETVVKRINEIINKK